MIVCSCNILTKNRILETAERLALEGPGRPLTPARVYRALGVRAQCTICFALVRKILADSGLMVTCPEPLGSGAEDEGDSALFG
ncbi:(2Fe-2S)-binding protein [Kaistia dalseonensis]|uniref:Bacterioferritin-associated ferredoxin n=1 Tax=Kaistia dalseonensis TaxID=410840 RepID=A0ABU0H9D4_9HYPH|nr:(2Fe-2S)-binding protein [Kaistia dalseonensis]MCX5496319.1 (2Fe-2S)-binding protein [Kaistia dalseonensis]MDQ0438938.1 bacterioferritin-associated ferredoxin [Kaistia dalseonensis]